MINRDRLVEKLDDEDVQQVLFEGIVKTKNLDGFINRLTTRREALKIEIMRVMAEK